MVGSGNISLVPALLSGPAGGTGVRRAAGLFQSAVIAEESGVDYAVRLTVRLAECVADRLSVGPWKGRTRERPIRNGIMP